MKNTHSEDIRIVGILPLYDMQTDLYYRVLDGIADEDAHMRLNTKANHIAWLAGSLVQQRFELASMLSAKEYKQQADDLFRDNQGIKDGVTYPSLEQYKQDWKTIAPILRDALANAKTEKLDTDMGIPDMKMSFYEMAYFCIYREANHIGQIALWRRLLSYEPMKYM